MAPRSTALEGAGPSESGEFWTEAVQGSDVVIELQTGPDGAPDLPFKIDAIEAAQLSDLLPPAPKPVREIVQSLYRDVPIMHEVVDGMGIFEGDILLGPVNELQRARSGGKDRGRSAIGITGSYYRWPGATLPYVISATLPSPTRVTDAIAHWNTAMAGAVRMVPRTNETAYVSFNRAASSGTCSSHVGKVFSGAQSIEIGDSCSRGSVIHEIGHAWGLWHEHTREDRNRYVTIHLENIKDDMTYNFTQNISNGDDTGAYDYGSIMHYSATSFSKNGLPTITTVPTGISIGQRSALSSGNIAGIKAVYPSGTQTIAPPKTAVTVTANPVGAPVSVDGVSYTSPASFSWTVNSVHTIAAVNTADDSMRRTFVKWSDGGTQSHTITTPSSVTTFKVDYALAYSIKATGTPVGTVAFNPASPDTFYASGQGVYLTATSPTGYCFAGWNGFIAGTPYKTRIMATQAYNVQAMFQPGTITLTRTSVAAPVEGGAYPVDVKANSGCLWNVVADSWLTVTQVTAASGSGTVSFTAPPNTTGVKRIGYVVVGGKNLVVSQPGS